MTILTVLHPGAMGASVGAAAAAAGHEVRWVSDGRSTETRGRAAASGLVEHPSLASALDGTEVVLSICPPAAAADVAVAVAGFRGVFVDANAVSPSTARDIAAIVVAGGATAVDGGIVGPPATRAGTTRLFLSGADAARVAGLFVGTALEVEVVAGAVGAASALKVAYAAWTKGSAALLLAVAAYAEHEGVRPALLAEWERSQPDLADRLALTAAGVAPKAWRFAGELADSASAFSDAALPHGFGRAASEVYERLAGFKNSTSTVSVDDAIAAIRAGRN